MKGLGVLGAFFGGAIAGAVIGLLLAPEKGEDTREKIIKRQERRDHRATGGDCQTLSGYSDGIPEIGCG